MLGMKTSEQMESFFVSEEKIRKSFLILSKILQVAPPELDENHTCMLEVAEGFFIHFKFFQDTGVLYISHPLLEGLPDNHTDKALLFEKILEAAWRLHKPEVGSIALDKESEQLVLYFHLNMGDTDELFLSIWLPLFIESCMSWRDFLKSPHNYFGQREKKLVEPERMKKVQLGVLSRPGDEDSNRDNSDEDM